MKLRFTRSIRQTAKQWLLASALCLSPLSGLIGSFAAGAQSQPNLAESSAPAGTASSGTTNALISVAGLPTSSSPGDSGSPLSPPPTRFVPRPARNAYEAQLVMARLGISPGSLDGVIGPQTRAAFRAFQAKEGLPITGQLDAVTQSKLRLIEAPERTYVITGNDLARLHPVPPTWLGKSMHQRLDYETILELLSEKGRAHPNFIRQLNPALDWGHVAVGIPVVIPDIAMPPVRAKATLVRIYLRDRVLQAFDEGNRLLAHFPCSIARQVEKRPLGELFVEKIAGYPSYRFDPKIFPESEEARQLGRVLHIPPGPNNPVGTAWIGLNRPGYGIHGSPRPESVGRTESHGCFRLANWNAEYLAQLVRNGTRVIVAP